MTKTSAFAGLSLDVDKPVRIPIPHPVTEAPLKDKEGKEAYLEMISGDSATAEKIRKDVRAKRQRSRNPDKIDYEAEDIDLLAALTKGWYLVDFDGNPIDVKCTPETVATLYREPETLWLRDLANKAAGDRGNFVKASSKT